MASIAQQLKPFIKEVEAARKSLNLLEGQKERALQAVEDKFATKTEELQTRLAEAQAAFQEATAKIAAGESLEDEVESEDESEAV